MIPKGWAQSTVGEVFAFQRTVALSRAQLSDGAPCGYIHYGDIHVRWKTHLDLGVHELPSCALELVPSATRIADGDLVLADASEDLDGVGKAVEVRNVGERSVVAGLHTVLMRPKPQTFAPGFAGFLTSMPAFVAQARILAAGLKVFGLSKSSLAKITVFLPPMLEQQAIAEALSDADALVESLDALIAKKRDMKQAAMQQLLTGGTRLPGFSEEWRATPVAEVADLVAGGTPSTSILEYWDGDIPWCTPTDITSTEGNTLLYTDRTITQAGLTASAANLLPEGSLLLCTRATVGDVRIAGQPTATNQGFKSLVVKSPNDNVFIYYQLATLRNRLLELSSGSTFLELSKKDLARVELLLPPPEEQQAIAEILSDMDAEIDALVARREKAELVKQGMMQELLSGRVRLV